MAEIKTFVSGELTLRKIVGEVSSFQLTNAILQYYSGQITKHLIWDVTEGTVRQLTPADVRSIAEIAQKHADARIGGKTALVASTDVDFGMGAMFESFVKIRNTSFDTQVFRSLSDAAKWIGVDELPGIGKVTPLPDKPNQP